MARTPYVFCPVCRFFDECDASAWSRRLDMFQCYRDARTVDIDAQRAHLERLAVAEGVSVPEDFLLRILDLVRASQGEVARPIEYSVTWDGQEEHWYRFSAVYWDLRPDSQRKDLEHALATSRLFGSVGEGRVREAILGAMGAGAIYQVLYGIDLRPKGSRQKIYLRLGRGEISWKEDLVKALVPGFERDLAVQSLDILRLIGIDLLETGCKPRVKLYYMPGQVTWERAVSMAGRHPFLQAIEGRCPDPASRGGHARQEAARRDRAPYAQEPPHLQGSLGFPEGSGLTLPHGALRGDVPRGSGGADFGDLPGALPGQDEPLLSPGEDTTCILMNSGRAPGGESH